MKPLSFSIRRISPEIVRTILAAVLTAWYAHMAQAEGDTAPTVLGLRPAVAEQQCDLAGYRLLSGTYLIAPHFWRNEIDESLIALELPARHSANTEKTIAGWTLKKAAADLPIVEVPALVGLSHARGLEALHAAGLVAMTADGAVAAGTNTSPTAVAPTTDASSTDAKIVECYPPAGTSVYQGTSIYLRTSGPAAALAAPREFASPATAAAKSDTQIVTPELGVDWRTGEVTLLIPLELPAGAAALRLAAADDADQDNLELKRVERGLSIRGSVAALRRALEAGTRSLPIDVASPAGDGAAAAPANPATEPAGLIHYRADLPTIDVVKASKQAGDESRGPTLSLWIKGLTPEFTIDAAAADEATDADDERHADAADFPGATVFRKLPVGTDVGDGARITRAEPDGDLGVRIDLELAPPPPAAARLYRIAVVDGFGSRTRTLAVRQTQSDIDGELRSYLPATAAPIGEFTVAPRLELLDFAEAARLARDAGLTPLAWSPAGRTFAHVRADDARLVVAQGAPPGRRLRRGEILLLAIEEDSAPSLFDDRPPPRVAAGAGDPFGFVAVPERRSMTHAESDDESDDDATSVGGLAVASASTPGDGSAAVDPAQSDATPAAVPGDETALLPVAAGTWVPLDPRLDPAEVEGRASMKAIVDAVSARLNGEPPPGVAGRLLGDVVKDFEDDLAGPGSRPGGLESAVGAITDEVVERLNVNLTADERSRLVAACSAAQAGGLLGDAGGGPATDLDALRRQLDRNGNGFAADDVAAWILAQLLSGKHVQPTVLGQVVPGATGTPVAVLPSQPSTGGKPAEPAVTVVDEEITIPAGKPTESAETMPTKVRVPPLDEAPMLPDYLARLRAVGLSAAKEGKFFEKDKVLAAVPAANEWVAPATPIKLELERLVPDVAKLGAQEAVAALRDKDFKAGLADPDRKYRNDDVVVGQSPESGEYRRPGTKVDLSIKRPVPKVTGSKLADAVALLQSREFEVRVPETRRDDDVIAEQSPAAGTPADVGSQVTFLRLATTMPDLAGGSLAQAKTLKEARELLAARAIKYSLVEPRSDYLSARVIAQSPKFGTRIDRETEEAKLALVIQVPEVGEPVTLAKAVESLKIRTLEHGVTANKAQDDDYVMDLNVAQGERQFPAGGRTYVYPGSKIVLKIGRPVPQVNLREWAGGLAAVRDRGFDVSTPAGSGTHVYSTEPAGGKLADLRFPVRVNAGIKVPGVDGLSWASAGRVLADVGLGLRAGSTTDVETDDRSLFNTLRVADDAGQSPAADRIVRKGSVDEVTVRALRYVERRAIVPDVVGLDPSEAGRRVERAELLAQFSNFDQPTSDERLAGTQQVASQEPGAGTRLRKGSKVFLRVRKYVYQSPLTTYAVRRSAEDTVVLTCVLSADRRSISVTSRSVQGLGGVPETVRGTLINDTEVFQGKRCFTYSFDLPRRRWGLRIPFDGVGPGQSLSDGVWVHVVPGFNPLEFGLQEPTFK